MSLQSAPFDTSGNVRRSVAIEGEADATPTWQNRREWPNAAFGWQRRVRALEWADLSDLAQKFTIGIELQEPRCGGGTGGVSAQSGFRRRPDVCGIGHGPRLRILTAWRNLKVGPRPYRARAI